MGIYGCKDTHDVGKGILTLDLDARRKVSVKYNGIPNSAERMGQDDEEYLSKRQQKLPRSQSHSQSLSLIQCNICRAFSTQGNKDLSAVQTLYRLGKEYQAIPSYRNSEDSVDGLEVGESTTRYAILNPGRLKPLPMMSTILGRIDMHV